MTVTTGILTAVTFTDNGNLAPKGSEQDSVQLQLTPYINLDLAGPRAQGYLYYAPSFYAQTLEGSTNYFSNNLTAFGNYYFYEDRAGIRADANVFDTNTSPFATSSVNPGINGTNVSTYQSYSVTPYARGRLGSATDYEARYRLAYTDQGTGVPTEVDNRVSGILGNVSGTSRLGWRALGTYATTSYSDGFDYDRAFVTALGYYVFSPRGADSDWDSIAPTTASCFPIRVRTAAAASRPPAPGARTLAQLSRDTLPMPTMATPAWRARRTLRRAGCSV